MAQLGKKFTAGILGALVLVGVSIPSAWAEQGGGQVPSVGAASDPDSRLEREISLKGKIVCLGCSLEDVQKQQPQAKSLYQLTYKQGRIVIQVDEVNDLRQWQRDTLSNNLHIRAADDVLSQLTDEKTVQKEVELTGRLGSDRVLDVTGILIRR